MEKAKNAERPRSDLVVDREEMPLRTVRWVELKQKGVRVKVQL
jgi:hypothetical protein